MPSIRQRYVRRARSLKEAPGFRKALDDIVSEWNKQYPRFEITRRGYPPDRPYELVEGVKLPPRLHAGASAVGLSKFLEAALQTNPIYPPKLWAALLVKMERENATHEPLTADDELANGAGVEWQRLTLDLCLRWWPPEYYYNWMGLQTTHPARWFVSACLIWDPRDVPEEWIRDWSLHPICTPSDPVNPERNLAIIYLEALYESFSIRIEAAVLNGTPITVEFLDRAHEQAERDADAAERRALPNPHAGYCYVPVYPGMTSSDWRNMEPSVIATLDSMFYGLEYHARRLHAEGKTPAEIAHLIGLSERQTRRYLSSS